MNLQEAPRAGSVEMKQRMETVARHRRLGLMKPKPVTYVPVVVEPEADLPAPITLRRIVAMTADTFNVTAKNIKSHRRTTNLIEPRRAISLLAKKLTSMTYPQISRALGDRDHTTIMNAYRKGEKAMLVDANFAAMVNDIEKRLIDAAGRHLMADLIVINGQRVGHLECPHCQRLVIEAKQEGA